MAMDDEEVERMYQAKLDYVREHGETPMQTRLRAEDNEVHPERSEQ